ncbi:MAG: hypothetical protein AAF604_02960 [Acidobacteriota bacterium]
MSRGFELLPLECPSCGETLGGDAVDVVFYCVACRSGHRVVEDRLEPVEVSFASWPQGAAEGYLPFWSLDAKVEIRQRKASGGHIRRFLSGGGEAPLERFLVPAYPLALAEAVNATLALSRHLPPAAERLGEGLTGGSVEVVDAQKMARYCVIAAEARQPDTLREFDFHVEFGKVRLLGIPYQTKDGRRVDVLTRHAI